MWLPGNTRTVTLCINDSRCLLHIIMTSSNRQIVTPSHRDDHGGEQEAERQGGSLCCSWSCGGAFSRSCKGLWGGERVDRGRDRAQALQQEVPVQGHLGEDGGAGGVLRLNNSYLKPALSRLAYHSASNSSLERDAGGKKPFQRCKNCKYQQNVNK